jgi:TorA maturation chaperone TorD
MVMQPIVDQIENEKNHDDYTKFISEHLSNCVGNLASCCVQDETLCRKFNYQILLKTKQSSVQVNKRNK